MSVVAGNLQIVGTIKIACSLGKTTQHQAIPGGQNFLVAPGLDALLPQLKEDSPATLQRLLQHFQIDMQIVSHTLGLARYRENILALKVPRFAHIVVRDKASGILYWQGLLGLFPRPDEELSFFPLAISILC